MSNHMTDIYLRLDYRQYKHLEDQLKHWDMLETTHTSVDGYYHKALRLEIGNITLEIQGPAVKEPIREADPVDLNTKAQPIEVPLDDDEIREAEVRRQRRRRSAADWDEWESADEGVTAELKMYAPPVAFSNMTAASINKALDQWWINHLRRHHDEERKRGRG